MTANQRLEIDALGIAQLRLRVRLHEDGRQAVEPVLERDRCEFGQQEAK